MHERIRRFTQEGDLGTDDFEKQKDLHRIYLEDRMRYDGYVPQLDCGLHWSTEYMVKSRTFKFKLTMYGIFVGKERAASNAVAYYDGKIHEA